MLGDKTTLTDYTDVDPTLRRDWAMQINPDIFKAYDIRGLYPARSTKRSRGRSAAASPPI